jgi:hypothetical protein
VPQIVQGHARQACCGNGFDEPAVLSMRALPVAAVIAGEEQIIACLAFAPAGKVRQQEVR